MTVSANNRLIYRRGSSDFSLGTPNCHKLSAGEAVYYKNLTQNLTQTHFYLELHQSPAATNMLAVTVV